MGTKKKTSCALVLIAALSCAPALAQSQPTTPAGSSSGAGQEGIKVHGDWTLTVRNPDGTIAALHQFKNALVTVEGAPTLLASLLLGTATTGHWSITLGVLGTTGTCGASPVCVITESTAAFPGHSSNLTKTVPTTGQDAGKFVLRGSVRFVNADLIGVVSTSLTTCASSTTPTCSNGSFQFTRKELAQGIQVSQDQLVEVKVVISFS